MVLIDVLGEGAQEGKNGRKKKITLSSRRSAERCTVKGPQVPTPDLSYRFGEQALVVLTWAQAGCLCYWSRTKLRLWFSLPHHSKMASAAMVTTSKPAIAHW
jgi:hypothetical protein